MADDCLLVSDFGRIEDGLPAILLKAAPLLVDFLNRADWPEQFEKALNKRSFDSLPAMRGLVRGNVYEFELDELLLLFVLFFEAVEHCSPGGRFIERAMVDQDCMC